MGLRTLSICIPTYNRAAYISEALESIISQASNEVEIIVSDNASQDNTYEIVLDFKSRFPSITYFRWDRNMGADRNFLKAVELAKGKYCWLLGSDDAIKPGAIDRILSEIELTKSDVYLTNRDYCNVKLKACAKQLWLNENEDHQYIIGSNNIAGYFANCISLGGVFSYLSSIVFLKELWDAQVVPDKYIGTAYVHAFILLSAMRDGLSLKYIGDSLVLCRGENDSFFDGSRTRRILLDYSGYKMMVDDVFGVDTHSGIALYSILGREITFIRILRACYESSDQEWDALCAYLSPIYPRYMLIMMGYTRIKLVRVVMVRVIGVVVKIKKICCKFI